MVTAAHSDAEASSFFNIVRFLCNFFAFIAESHITYVRNKLIQKEAQRLDFDQWTLRQSLSKASSDHREQEAGAKLTQLGPKNSPG